MHQKAIYLQHLFMAQIQDRLTLVSKASQNAAFFQTELSDIQEGFLLRFQLKIMTFNQLVDIFQIVCHNDKGEFVKTLESSFSVNLVLGLSLANVISDLADLREELGRPFEEIDMT